MTEEKQLQPESAPNTCVEKAECPLCCGLWPSSAAGKVIILVVLAAAAGVILTVQLLRTDVDALMAEGVRLFGEKRFEEAERTFEKVIEHDPNRPLALDYLGLLALKGGDVEQSILWRRRAAEIDPLTHQHFWNLAHIYFFIKKDYAACEEQLRRAMRLVHNAQYHLLYALCAVKRKLPDAVVVGRLRNVILAAEGQAHNLKPERLTVDGSFAAWWKEAAKRLAARGDRFGYDRLKELAEKSPKREVREFAKKLLGEEETKQDGARN